MPVRWKIFRVFNYLLMAGVILFCLLITDGINSLTFSGVADFLHFLLFLIGTLVLLINSLFNLHFLEKYYPDKQPGKALRTWHILLFILFLAITVYIYLIGIDILIDLLRHETHLPDNRKQLLALVMFAFILLTTIPIIWLQISLQKNIQRNFQHSNDSFLNSEEEC